MIFESSHVSHHELAVKYIQAAVVKLPYIGNHSRKKTFANFADFGMIVNVFLLPFSIF